MIELLTGLLVLITGFYAWATFRILKANEKVVAVMEAQAEALVRPYITIRAFLVPGNPIIFLGISNSGKTAAENLKLEIDRDFLQFGEKGGVNLGKLNAFQQKIETFSPGVELIFYLAQGPVLFGDKADPALTPLVFNIKASYCCSGRVFVETTCIDLRLFLHAVMNSDPIVERLGEIAKALKEIKRA